MLPLPAKPFTLEPRQLLHSTSSPQLFPFPTSILAREAWPFLAMFETASGLPAF